MNKRLLLLTSPRARDSGKAKTSAPGEAMSIKNRVVIVLLSAMALTTVAQATAKVVEVDSGKLRGSENAGVFSWKGIPFAAPPIGPNRWRAPQPSAAWKGVRD